jgi:hypothetical protein
MSEMSYAQLKEEKLRSLLKVKYPEISSFSFPQQWVIELIESILEEFPMLKAINYQELGANGLLSLVKTLIHDVEMFIDENETVLIIEARPTKSFLTMKEFIIIFLLSGLTKISLFHFIFTKKKMETIDCKDFEAFSYIDNSSVVQTNKEKRQYHFFTSVKSLVNYFYTSPDNFTKKMTSAIEFLKQYGDSSIADYIDKTRAEVNIDDISLTNYLSKDPIVIYTEKASISSFIKKYKL